MTAALLHDLGHVLGFEALEAPQMEGCGTSRHEAWGARFLSELRFAKEVAWLVGAHVDAKRYLCFKDEAYHASLSAASRTTLRHQGGPMDAHEAAEFERTGLADAALALRRCDEAAKAPLYLAPGEADTPEAAMQAFSRYGHIAQQRVLDPASASDCGTWQLSPLQRRKYLRQGFLVVENFFDDDEAAELSSFVEVMRGWEVHADPARQYLVHYERVKGCNAPVGANGAVVPAGHGVLMRVENAVSAAPDSPLARAALGSVAAAVGELFAEVETARAARKYGCDGTYCALCCDGDDEVGPPTANRAPPAHLFKDKVNYKQPGGAGFAAHLDSAAYRGLRQEHLTAMVAMDAADVTNGCLQVAADGAPWEAGDPRAPLDETLVDCVEAGAASRLRWADVVVPRGAVCFFSGWLPHRSSANRSSRERRAAFLTYTSPAEGGSAREAYYAEKWANMDRGAISFGKDFQGECVQLGKVP